MKRNAVKRAGLVILLFVFCFILPDFSSPAAMRSLDLKLLSRSPQLTHTLSERFNAEQQQWLATKKELVVGISRPQYPPFTVINNKAEFEGITADYTGLLAVVTGKAVQIQLFPSQQAANQALREGKIDLLGAVTQFEGGEHVPARSEPYASEQAILATRNDQKRSLNPDLAGEHIAMANGYLPPEWVQQRYPHASIQTYPSYQQAIGAVAFGDADVFLGDLYPISRNFLNNIHVVSFADFPAKELSFGVRPDNVILQQIINIALADVSNEERLNILQRWHVGRSNSLLSTQVFQLSSQEKQWIKQHPKVRVVAIDGFAPLTFTDDDGNYRGITVDVLSQIRLRTGLDFEITSADTVGQMQQMLADNEADMIGALTPSIERKSDLLFSRSYFTSAFVMVVRQQANAPRNLSELAGKRLAVIGGTGIGARIRSQHQGIQIIDAASATEALALLNSGKVDAAVNTLANSEYQIARYYRNRMRISATLGESPAYLSFAVPGGSAELLSIVDKVMLSIPPDEMDVIGNLWRPNNMVAPESFWRENRSWIYTGGAFAIGLVLVSLLWAFWLRRQIRIKTRVQRELNDQLEFMHDMINGTPNSTYIRDASGRLTQCNDSYLQDVGIAREHAVGQLLHESHIFSETGQIQSYIQDFYQVLSSGSPVSRDRTFLHPVSGQEKTVFHWILPYRDADGTVKGVIGGWLDISERRQLLEALSLAKEQAEGANRAKTLFLSTMSHEIRTPLNAVIGMLEMARKAADKNRVDHQALDVASDSANELVELLGDILDVARIESEKMTLQPESCSVQQLCRSVLRVFEGLAAQKDLTLSLTLEPESGTRVFIDPLRFRQILSNLVGNAIKFTRRGEVSVRVTITPTADSRWKIAFTVKDTGKGITPEDQLKLFAPFSQVGDHGDLSARGTGLGLIICKSLCEMMGGSIALRSLPGEGTEIDVVVYGESVEEHPPEPDETDSITPLSPLSPLRILIADDFRANRLLLTRQLHFLGHQVVEAVNGAEALEKWREGDFSTVITDCRMPVMDGYQLARAIRKVESEAGSDPCTILGFTASALPEELERCLAAGMNGCMFKPATLQDIESWLSSVPRTAEREANNSDSVHQLTGGDRALMAELMQSFQQDSMELAAALAEDDRHKLGELAHRIKGGARMTGASSLADAGIALEACCNRAESERKEIVEAGRHLLSELRRLINSLSQ